MGIRNSSITRVQPLCDYLGKDTSKINQLLGLFSKKVTIADSVISVRYGANEAAIAPSRELLKWCVENLEMLQVPKNFGVSKNSPSFEPRRQLFSGDSRKKAEALTLLERSKLPQKGWYIFEGYTHPDILIETESTIIVAEAKRTEAKLTDSTIWLPKRDQLLRHADSVIDSGKRILSFLIIDNSAIYDIEKYQAESVYFESLPHRGNMTIQKLRESYIGHTTWDTIVSKLGISFPDTVAEMA